MRQAINNNPIVQVAVLGGLALIVAVFFMTNMKGGGSSDSGSAASAPATSSPPATGSASPSTGPATAGSPAVPSAPPATVSPDALVPGPGLPKPLIAAWKGGDTVVLLVVRQGGIDDRLVHRSVRLLSGDSGASVFVTRANKVARYSRITQGVALSQAPALVVVRPRRVSGPTPEAQVAYGFRDAQGVVQAVHDAVYSGKDNLPYSPR
ncbi:MAG TPA: hypothetical protein VLB79_08405 [Solirubrobacterales bacterium]|nr:hypothetical protein [Solirubrobacterales bacterium]